MIGSGPRRTVLVIDDNVDCAVTLADVLRFYGYRVGVAFGAADGFRQAEKLRPDVILCDLGMPGMNGWELAAALRRNPRLASVRLIAVSGRMETNDVLSAVKAGFDAHIGKPPDIYELIELLHA